MYSFIRSPIFKNSVSLFSNTSSISFSRKLSFIDAATVESSNVSANYTVEEVKIHVPSIGGHLAGKLWQGPKSTENAQDENPPPPIICLHGIQDNCGSFDPLIPLILKDNMKIFTLDLPGHGHSYHTKALHYDFFLDGLTSIKRTLKHFGWDKATLLGHSLGSVISFMYSGTFPKQVHKYIAMDTVRSFPAENIAQTFGKLVEKLFEIESKLILGVERPTYTYEEILKKTLLGRKNKVTLEGCKALLIRGAEKVKGTDGYRYTHDLKTVIPSHLRIIGEDQTQMFAKSIKCPVCVIKGEPGGNYESVESFLRMVNLMSEQNENVEFHLVPGKTHHFHLNEPQLVAPIINKFLDS